jgi:hypothetical protein
MAPPLPNPALGDRIDLSTRRRKHSRFQAWGWRRQIPASESPSRQSLGHRLLF